MIVNCSVIIANDAMAPLNTAVWLSHETGNIDQGKYSFLALDDYNLCIFDVIFN